MVAEYGQLDGLRELARAPQEGRTEQTPIGAAARLPDAEEPERAHEGQQVAGGEGQARPAGT